MTENRGQKGRFILQFFICLLSSDLCPLINGTRHPKPKIEPCSANCLLYTILGIGMHNHLYGSADSFNKGFKGFIDLIEWKRVRGQLF